ncbi:zinc-binding dehydrogenase [Flavobacteriaceae bacterium W22]|nr:zinc-binding dehydrogenase [Flavobacteriaceae bacterium W22]
MKAIQYTAFGNADVVTENEVPKAAITQENQVLVKVKAFTINPLDMKIRQGYMQQVYPVQFPFTPGLDAAGIVEAVGSEVKNFNMGDEVMVSAMGGTYAEYCVVPEQNVAKKPAEISFEEAAALVIPMATAQSLLVNVGNVQAGQKVFVQGASGAVGAALIQLAKALGAYAIGTASGEGVDFIKNLGADEAIDYKTQDFTQLVKEADLVIDCAGGPSQNALFEVLKKGGTLLSITMPPSQELAEQFGVKAQFVSSDLSAKNMQYGLQLLAEGKLKPSVAQTFTMSQAAEAQNLVSAGGVNGKVVLTVG